MGETGLGLARARGRWTVYPADTRLNHLDWMRRNRGLLLQSFARLCDARDFLEALFAVDPPPCQELFGQMRRIGPGEYRLTTSRGIRFRIHRAKGSSYWSVKREDNGQAPFDWGHGTLWQVQQALAREMR